MTHKITRALAALVVAGALVSCAADAEPQASGDRDRDRKGKDVGKKNDGKPGQARGVQKSGNTSKSAPAKRDQDGSGSTSSGTGSSGNATGSGPGTSPASNPPAAAKPACLDDASGDTDRGGSTPAYVDLAGGCLRVQGDQLVLEATAAGAIPRSMPDQDTESAYGFQLEPANGSEIYVYAQGSPSGWMAYVARDGNQRRIAAPTVSGNQLTMTIPAAELGRGTWQWLVESSFLKPGLLTTNYAFDTAPNAGTARFDR